MLDHLIKERERERESSGQMFCLEFLSQGKRDTVRKYWRKPATTLDYSMFPFENTCILCIFSFH